MQQSKPHLPVGDKKNLSLSLSSLLCVLDWERVFHRVKECAFPVELQVVVNSQV